MRNYQEYGKTYFGKKARIKKGVRRALPLASVGKMGWILLYTHLNSIGIVLFEDGYREEELFEV